MNPISAAGTDSDSESDSRQEAPAETTVAAEWPKTIVDVVGNEITQEGPATRLVSTRNPTMNIAVILGGRCAELSIRLIRKSVSCATAC